MTTVRILFGLFGLMAATHVAGTYGWSYSSAFIASGGDPIADPADQVCDHKSDTLDCPARTGKTCTEQYTTSISSTTGNPTRVPAGSSAGCNVDVENCLEKDLFEPLLGCKKKPVVEVLE